MSDEDIKFLFCIVCDKFTIHSKTKSSYKCGICGKERGLLRRQK
jgi:ribosomal protein S14